MWAKSDTPVAPRPVTTQHRTPKPCEPTRSAAIQSHNSLIPAATRPTRRQTNPPCDTPVAPHTATPWNRPHQQANMNRTRRASTRRHVFHRNERPKCSATTIFLDIPRFWRHCHLAFTFTSPPSQPHNTSKFNNSFEHTCKKTCKSRVFHVR
ncbi:hypothetical protein THER5_1888 [Bifidobacterium thermacidophilum subsp. thermacidophilum]|uniref:Uncharacterized protein n=1 Tax=Bifidobacterium thermacidophilum subsp. thermacidophilum TaxID=79262 RepID=A0A087E446_9BIFI|nr:hypothetical protein THER5_1888 [Bifidobacterium thermacidophilum subsp. thermacidophilum]